jgi:hypothetical protein
MSQQRTAAMQLPFNFQALEEDLPKIAATSVLIPILQWVTAQIWKYRRRSRLATLRKDISELNDFISKQKAYAGEPGIDQSIRIAEEERSCLVEKLNLSFDPQRTGYRRLAVILLFDIPKNIQALIARIVAYAMLVEIFVDAQNQIKGWVSLVPGQQPRVAINLAATVALELLFFLFLYYVAKRANSVSGEVNRRPLWRVATLIYHQPMLYVAAVHVCFFFALTGTLIVVISHFTEVEQGAPFPVILGFAAVASFFWLMARHLDRKPMLTASLSPVSALDKA